MMPDRLRRKRSAIRESDQVKRMPWPARRCATRTASHVVAIQVSESMQSMFPNRRLSDWPGPCRALEGNADRNETALDIPPRNVQQDDCSDGIAGRQHFIRTVPVVIEVQRVDRAALELAI